MSAQHDLLAYLQEQADDGVVESEGDFTVSLQNARKKLARFALPRETAWVSKLVQAAVGWQMKAVLVAQSKNETQFFFHPSTPTELPTPNQVVNALLSGKIVLETPLDHFCLGLRALVEQATLSFLLVVNDGEVKPQPIYAGDHYGNLSEKARLGEKFDRAVGMTLTVRHSPPVTLNSHLSEIVGLKQFGIPILEELRDYAYTSSVPIIQSGRHLEGFLDSSLFKTKSQIPLIFSGLNSLIHSPECLPLPASFEEKQFSFLSHPRRRRRPYGGRKDFACAYILEGLSPQRTLSGFYRRSSFKWVRDGIVVQSSLLNVRTQTLGLHIFANAEGLKSDLTGFQLIREEKFFARESEILETLSEQIKSWIEKVENFFRQDTDEKSPDDVELDTDLAFRKRVKFLLKGSAAGLLLTLVNPPFGVTTTLGTVATAYAPHLLKKGAQDIPRRKALAKTLTEDLLILSKVLGDLGRQVGEMKMTPEIAEIDPTDEDQIADLIKQYEAEPEKLIAELKKRMASETDQPLWCLHLARVYRAEESPRAASFYNLYLEERPEPKIFDELIDFYENSGKKSLADMVRWRKGNPSS